MNRQILPEQHRTRLSDANVAEVGFSTPYCLPSLSDEFRVPCQLTWVLHCNDDPACKYSRSSEQKSDRPPSRSARSNSRVLEEAENSRWTESILKDLRIGFSRSKMKIYRTAVWVVEVINPGPEDGFILMMFSSHLDSVPKFAIMDSWKSVFKLKRDFQWILVCPSTTLSHLFYADDAYPDNVVAMKAIRVGKGTGTSFWKDLWIGDNLLKLSFPRLFALEENKDISVAVRWNTFYLLFFSSLMSRGVESQQLDQSFVIT
ncbi:hypothetical protein Tco_1302087 [Tanacetum coccineum]